MWILERIFTALAVIFFLFFGAFLVLFSVHYFSISEVNSFILTYFHRWPAAVAGIIILLWAVGAFIFGLRRQERTESISQPGSGGDIDISLSTIDNIMDKTARQTKGVREVKPRVRVEKGVLYLTVEIYIAPDIIIPALAESLQVNIKEQVERMTGLTVGQVRVLVRNIHQELRAKGGRVG